MTQDEQSLDLLAVFHYVVGALTAIFSCMFFFHVAIGVAMLCGEFDGKNPPPRVFAWAFIVIASVLILMGWTLAGLIVAAGRKLQRRRSYLFCLVIAALECFLMPFGTVLGVFTILVLMKEPAKRLFSSQSLPQSVPPID